MNQQNKTFRNCKLLYSINLDTNQGVFHDKILFTILKHLSVIHIFPFKGVCKKFKQLLLQWQNEFIYFDSINLLKPLPNLYVLKVLQRFKSIVVFKCHSKITTSELGKFLETIKPTLRDFEIQESSVDFSKLFRTLTLPDLKKFSFTNTRKVIEDVDMKALVKACPNLSYLDFSNVSSINNLLLSICIPALQSLETFILKRNVNVNNEILVFLRNSIHLKHLEIGGHPTEFNNSITYEGVEALTMIKSKLRVLKFQYCSKIGDLSISTIAQSFGPSLEEFSVERNYFEKSAKIGDDCLKSFQSCPNLQRLEIIYSRKFEGNIALHLSKHFKNLKYLNLSGCPIQVSLEPLNVGCPKLEELNLSGDSWVKKLCLLGIAKHRSLQTFHLGHFEHSDFKCQEVACEYPPKGFYICGLFEKKENFQNLNVLYLEKNCDLSDFLVNKINKLRKNLIIRFNNNQSLIGESLEINDEDDQQLYSQMKSALFV